MSLTGQTLKTIWSIFSGICDKAYKRQGILNVRDMDFETYLVKCPQTADKIHKWADEKNRAEQAIDSHLSREFSIKTLGISGPVYKLDETGHVEAVRLRDWMTFSQPGWEAKNINSNWLVPIKPKTGVKKEEHLKEVSGENKKEDRATRYLREQTMLGERKREELQALPAVPSYEILKGFINWPDMQPEPWEVEAMDQNFIEYAHATDRLLVPFGFGEHVFIEVPVASSFEGHPSIQEKIENWVKPDFLKPVSREEIAALKSDFEQKKCLQEQQKRNLQL